MTFYLFSESAVYCHASYSLVQYYLTALSLECYECTSVPGFSGASACDSNAVTKRTCNKFFDRCMTLTYNFTILSTSRIVELKNCSSSFTCDAGSDFNLCKIVGDDNFVSDCSFKCCEGDLCNSALVIAASFYAIFSAVALAIFVN